MLGELSKTFSIKKASHHGFSNYFASYYYYPTVDKVINRFAKQRQHGNCPVKAQIKEEENTKGNN